MKRIFFIFILFAQTSLMSAQTLTIETVEVCAAQEVLVPVDASSLNNIGAITLYIGFDTNNLTFLSIENIDPQLAGMSSNYMPVQAQIAFAWSNTIPINFTTGKLFDLKFSSNSASGNIQFNAGCEISDTSGTVINTIYNNGAINYGMPIITLSPVDTTVIEGSIARFHTSSPNAINYAWLESQDNGISWLTLEENEIYTGTTSGTLTINPVSLTYHNNLYKCLISRGSCTTYSGSARLSVDELTATGKSLSGPGQSRFTVNPNPAGSYTVLNCHLNEPANLNLYLFNQNGQQTESIAYPGISAGDHDITINTSTWMSGVYVLRVEAISHQKQFNQSMKIIKN